MEQLLEILSDLHPEVDFEECDTLIDDGINLTILDAMRDIEWD